MAPDAPLSKIGHELLDDPAADPAVVRESLHHLARSNAWFGGLAAVRAGLRRLLGGEPLERLTLLDVGTGKGDIPRALEVDFAVRPLGIDRHRAAARLATANGVPTAVADGRSLPFGSRAVDVVLVSQLAHHFSPEGIVALVREVSRVARLGVVLADLARSRLAQVGFHLGSFVLGFDRVTRADGITSLKRGFRPAELARLVEEAGFAATVTSHWGARLVATWHTAR